MARAEPLEEVKGRGRDAARRAKPWVEATARAGYVAKGTIYAVIGLLAMLEALGAGGKTASPDGAIRSIGSQPFGGALLVALAAGLAGYAFWKVVQGVTDPDGKGSGAHGLLRRACYVGSGAIHGVLAFTAAQSVFGAEDTSEDALAASAMAYQPPLGRFLVAAVGVGVVLVGLYQLYAALRANFKDDLKRHRMNGAEELSTILAGRVGTAARAVALGVAGAFVLVAAYQSDPEETRGLGGALEALQRQPLGSAMLGTVAAGLIVYGLFMFLVARRRHVDASW